MLKRRRGLTGGEFIAFGMAVLLVANGIAYAFLT